MPDTRDPLADASPEELLARYREAKANATRAAQERDTAYRERAQLVALLAALYPSHIGHTDPDAPDWAVVTVEAPTGQMSWHVAPDDRDLFILARPTSPDDRAWDGHSTEEKYVRVRALVRDTVSARRVVLGTTDTTPAVDRV